MNSKISLLIGGLAVVALVVIALLYGTDWANADNPKPYEAYVTEYGHICYITDSGIDCECPCDACIVQQPVEPDKPLPPEPTRRPVRPEPTFTPKPRPEPEPTWPGGCVCHKKESAPGKVTWLTKCFNPNQKAAYDAHIAHGDSVGACQ